MIKGNLSPQQLDALLDRLSHDDAFREHLLGDPAGALKEYGLQVDAAALPKSRKLPSKDELKQNRKAVNDKVSDNLGLIILLV
jgi:putative modified peptide